MKRLRARIRGGTIIDDPIWYFPTDPETGKPFEGDAPDKPGVGIRLRYIPPTEYRRIIQESTRRTIDVDTKQWVELIDNALVADTVCKLAVEEWYGIEDANGDPLACRPDIVLLALDIQMRAEVQYRATRSLSVVEVAEHAASFRESSGVGDVVESMGEGHAMLSASDAGGTPD